MTHFLSPQKVRNDKNTNHVLWKRYNPSKAERTGQGWSVISNLNETLAMMDKSITSQSGCASLWTWRRPGRPRQGIKWWLMFRYSSTQLKTIAPMLAHSMSWTFSWHPDLCKVDTQLFFLPCSLLPPGIINTNNYLPTWTRQETSWTSNALNFNSQTALWCQWTHCSSQQGQKNCHQNWMLGF